MNVFLRRSLHPASRFVYYKLYSHQSSSSDLLKVLMLFINKPNPYKLMIPKQESRADSGLHEVACDNGI